MRTYMELFGLFHSLFKILGYGKRYIVSHTPNICIVDEAESK